MSTGINIKINNISQNCKNPFNNNEYKLLGIVVYKRATMTRQIQIGHYIAICLRAGTWVEYNDLDKKERILKNNTFITPALLIYAKVKPN